MATQQTHKASLASEDARETNTQTLLKNAPEVIEFGKKAAVAWKSADSQNSKGNQLAIYALFHAFHKVTLQAVIVDRKGEVEDTFDFDLSEFATEPKNQDGTRNNKVLTARTNAIAEHIFGIAPENVTQAFKNRLSRAMEVVFHFVKLEYGLEDVQLAEKGGKQMLKLPYTALNDPPKPNDKGEIDEEKLDHYNRLKDSFVLLDGTKGKTVEELHRKAMPKRNREGANETQQKDKGSSFKSALNLTVAVLQTFTSKEGESEVAVTEELRKQMWNLQGLLAKYFDAEPVSREEEEGFSKKANGK